MSATFPKPGPAGSAGPAGISPFTYVQAVPSSDFIVTHNLGRAPVSVQAFDSDGDSVWVGVQVLDDNRVEITTVAELPFSGKVLVI